jgi:carbon storage regulator
MLVLSRRLNEKIMLPDQNITVQVLSIKGGTVRLGIDAPLDVGIFREEVLQKQIPLPICGAIL